MSYGYGFGNKRIARTCDCGSEFVPREPDQRDCRACLDRRARRGRVIPPKGLADERHARRGAK